MDYNLVLDPALFVCSNQDASGQSMNCNAAIDAANKPFDADLAAPEFDRPDTGSSVPPSLSDTVSGNMQVDSTTTSNDEAQDTDMLISAALAATDEFIATEICPNPGYQPYQYADTIEDQYFDFNSFPSGSTAPGYVGAYPDTAPGYVGAYPDTAPGHVGAYPGTAPGHVGAYPDTAPGHVGAYPYTAPGHIGAYPDTSSCSGLDPVESGHTYPVPDSYGSGALDPELTPIAQGSAPIGLGISGLDMPGFAGSGLASSAPPAKDSGPGAKTSAPASKVSGPASATKPTRRRGRPRKDATTDGATPAPVRQNAPIPTAPAGETFQRKIPSVVDHPDPLACPICYHCYCQETSVKQHLLEKHPELKLTKKTIETDPRYANVRTLSYYRDQGLDVSYRGNDRKQVNARLRMDKGMTTNAAEYLDNVYKQTPAERMARNRKLKTQAKAQAEENDKDNE